MLPLLCAPDELVVHSEPDDALVECVVVSDRRVGIRDCSRRRRRDARRGDGAKIGIQIFELGTPSGSKLPLNARASNPAFARAAPRSRVTRWLCRRRKANLIRKSCVCDRQPTGRIVEPGSACDAHSTAQCGQFFRDGCSSSSAASLAYSC